MKIEKILEKVKGSELIPADLAEQLLSFGITEFLSAGCSYEYATDLLAKAEIAIQREKSQGLM